MSKFEECMDTYKASMTKLGIDCDEDLLTKVAKGLGPSIYNKDSSTVASSDKGELETVKKNFLVGKLGCAESDDLDGIIGRAVEKMGASNPSKYRAVMYYLMVKDLGKESVYA